VSKITHIGQPQLAGSTRLVDAQGKKMAPPDHAAQMPVQMSMDPETGSVAIVDRRTNSQVLFGASGIIGFRDAFGTLIQTTTDGKLIIKANSIELVTDTQADGSPGVKVVELTVGTPDTPSDETQVPEDTAAPAEG